MSLWPDVVDGERLTGALLRVDLYEGRYLAVVEYHNVVNHLLRSASAACLLALALAPHERRAPSLEAARTFLRQTADAPPGSVHNARLAAAALLEDAPTLQAAARACELSDAGLGLPWRRFATALDTNDATGAAKSAHTWLREKMEATHTNEWGAYNEIPIEVSAALALAGARGLFVKLASNRVMTALRA